jgi:hypothetical protein
VWFVRVVADSAFVLAEWALSPASQLPQVIAMGCRGLFAVGVWVGSWCIFGIVDGWHGAIASRLAPTVGLWCIFGIEGVWVGAIVSHPALKKNPAGYFSAFTTRTSMGKPSAPANFFHPTY